MATYFITRHRGAREWAERRGIRAKVCEHLDMSSVRSGDYILGTLPINLVADVNALGGRYFHLVIDLKPELRGRELSADDMEICGADLIEYRAARVTRKRSRLLGVG